MIYQPRPTWLPYSVDLWRSNMVILERIGGNFYHRYGVFRNDDRILQSSHRCNLSILLFTGLPRPLWPYSATAPYAVTRFSPPFWGCQNLWFLAFCQRCKNGEFTGFLIHPWLGWRCSDFPAGSQRTSGFLRKICAKCAPPSLFSNPSH